MTRRIQESNSDDGEEGRGVRLRAISIVTCWRVHVQGYRVYEAHEYHSPRPFMLPIIIEKERRNRARPPGKLASSMPLCIPSADTHHGG